MQVPLSHTLWFQIVIAFCAITRHIFSYASASDSVGVLKTQSSVHKRFSACVFVLQVQCCALDVLPLAPPDRIFKLLTDAELAKHILAAIQSSLPEVRQAAVTAVGQLLSNNQLLRLLAPTPAAVAAANQWTAALGNALMDSVPLVCAATHVAMLRLLGSLTHQRGTDAELLKEQLAGVICQRVVKSLGTILEQAQMLSAAEQVCLQKLVRSVDTVNMHTYDAASCSTRHTLSNAYSASNFPAAAHCLITKSKACNLAQHQHIGCAAVTHTARRHSQLQ